VSQAHLLVLVGALLLAAGCSRPLDAAVLSANAAATTLEATHHLLTEQRRADEAEAARRVRGDRSDPAVRAEQLDRALAVGRKYRRAWDAYDVAYHAWAATVATIQAAQAGHKNAAASLFHALQEVAMAIQAMQRAAQEATHAR